MRRVASIISNVFYSDPFVGSVQVVGSGVIRAVMPRPDDFELYLLHLATEYVSATQVRRHASDTSPQLSFQNENDHFTMTGSGRMYGKLPKIIKW